MKPIDLDKWQLADPWADPRKAASASAADVLAVQQAMVAHMIALQTERWLKKDDRGAVRECEKAFDMAWKTSMTLASILKSPGV